MYDATNIANIKRSGQLANYISHERSLITALTDAVVLDTSPGTVAVAHLIGHYGVSAEGWSEPHAVADLQASIWSKQWPVSGFVNQSAAKAYARAAVINALRAHAATVLVEARDRLAALEAAQ